MDPRIRENLFMPFGLHERVISVKHIFLRSFPKVKKEELSISSLATYKSRLLHALGRFLPPAPPILAVAKTQLSMG